MDTSTFTYSDSFKEEIVSNKFSKKIKLFLNKIFNKFKKQELTIPPKKQLPNSIPITFEVKNTTNSELTAELLDCINRVFKENNPEGIEITSPNLGVSMDEIIRCIAFGDVFRIGKVYFTTDDCKIEEISEIGIFTITSRNYTGSKIITPEIHTLIDPYQQHLHIRISHVPFDINKWTSFKITVKPNQRMKIIFYPSQSMTLRLGDDVLTRYYNLPNSGFHNS